jgi:DNA-binding CsgD family transcriptional regulator
VKAHLHNAFAKLGIKSRAALNTLLHGTNPPTN